MNFWLRLIGFDPERIPADAEMHLVWTNAPQSWKVFVLLAVVAVVIYIVLLLYRREIDTCPKWSKRLLAGLRLAALALLLAIFLGPAVAPIQEQTSYPNVALVRDSSQSMNTQDRYLDEQAAQAVSEATSRTVSGIRSERPTRAALMHDVLEQDSRKFLRDIEQLGKLRLMDFGSDVVDVETRPVRKRDLKPKQTDTPESLKSAKKVDALPHM